MGFKTKIPNFSHGEMMSQIRIGILFGGKSGEHDVSILSAESIFRAIDKNQFLVIPIGILKNGHIANAHENKQMLSSEVHSLIPNNFPYNSINISSFQLKDHVDVIFPVLHGPNGEDGTIQGCLEIADIPYVGSGVIGSSTGMDKEIMKRIFMSHQLPVLPFYSFKKYYWQEDSAEIIFQISNQIGFPCFVKPANMGSSVGISKVKYEADLKKGIELALKYDNKIIVEKGIEAQEIEVSVLGNDNPQASLPGEIIPDRDFYDYDSKYSSSNSKLVIPAILDSNSLSKIREYAIKAFSSLDCAGLSRVDFFVDKKDHEIYINEINTMPGFTKISMYPKLWEASGIGYQDLISKLIDLALERYENKIKLF